MFKDKRYEQYYAQRASAVKRIDCQGTPIEFKLTFDEWLDIWISSEKFGQRGIRKGQYCMSRYNDIGHYEIGNVFIQPVQQNTKDGWKSGVIGNKGRPHSQQTKQKISNATKGRTAWNKKDKEITLCV
jgi:hypothetical protein